MADSIIAEKSVVTRKPHRCQACGYLYPSQTPMQRTTNVDGGRIESCYWCDICVKFFSQMDPLDLSESAWDMDIWEADGYREFAYGLGHPLFSAAGAADGR